MTSERIAAHVATVGVIAVLTLFIWVSLAWSHEWYPAECCSDNDCAPIPLAETPVEKDGGYTLTDGRHVAYKKLKPSPDGKWHLCEQKWPAEPTSARKILCIYAPLGGV